jgi:dihydrofolate reductase
MSDPPTPSVRKLKEEPGRDIVVLGSSSIVSPLIRAGLVDEYKIRVQPVILGAGRPLVHGQDRRHPLKLVNARTFRSGVVALHYEPAERPGPV